MERFLASIHSMYTNSATGEEIYRVKFSGTTGFVDIRATDCIDLSIRMALAEYDGIPPLPQGETLVCNRDPLHNSRSDSDHGADVDSGSDTFCEDFLAKCGIYPGERLYKPKRTSIVEGVHESQDTPPSLLAGMSLSGFVSTVPASKSGAAQFKFPSPVRAILETKDLSVESDGSDWQAVFRDFPEASPYSFDSDSVSSMEEPAHLLGEIGVYSRGIEKLPLEEQYADYQWESQQWNFRGSRDTFSGPRPGPTTFYGRRTPAIHSFFSLFWPKATLDEIVTQTNAYASQPVHSSDGRHASKLNGGPKWKKLTVKSFKAWLGIVVYMGLKSEPALKDYWSNDSFFGCPIVRNVMSRDRFLNILRNIHLVDNSKLCTDRKQPEFDKLGKVRWLVDSFMGLCKQLLNPNKFLTVDEIMIAYKGRYCSFQQYMMNKPVKYGIKVYATAYSQTRYVWNFEVYLGAPAEPTKSDYLVSAQVVLRLTDELSHRGHCVVVDNFFTGIQLFDTLLTKGFFATGTSKSNAKYFPKSLTGHHKRDRESRGTLFQKMHSGQQMAAVCWFDSQVVHFLSTHSSPLSINCFIQRWISGRHVVLPTCPMILEYVTHMISIDVVDQKRANYTCQIRSNKWWHRLLLFIVDTSLGNSYVSYELDCSRRGARPISRKAYHQVVAEWLTVGSVKVGRTVYKGFSLRKGLHFSMRHPERKRCKCRICDKKQIRICKGCGWKYICEGTPEATQTDSRGGKGLGGKPYEKDHMQFTPVDTPAVS